MPLSTTIPAVPFMSGSSKGGARLGLRSVIPESEFPMQTRNGYLNDFIGLIRATAKKWAVLVWVCRLSSTERSSIMRGSSYKVNPEKEPALPLFFRCNEKAQPCKLSRVCLLI